MRQAANCEPPGARPDAGERDGRHAGEDDAFGEGAVRSMARRAARRPGTGGVTGLLGGAEDAPEAAPGRERVLAADREAAGDLEGVDVRSRQPSAVSFQLSAISFRLSAFSFQL